MGTRSERPGRPYGDDASDADTVPLDRGAGAEPESEPPRVRQLGTRPPVRMCVRCQVTTETPVVVCVVHQNSGPGFTVYACQASAPHFPPSEPPDVPTRARGEK
jgi:hypothetical protein